MSIAQTLFALLDAAVAAGPPVGVQGRLAIGVLEDELRWWLVELDPAREGPPTPRRSGDIPEGLDAALVLGRDEAARLLQGESLDGKLATLQLFGDKALLKRFVGRYLKRHDQLSIRLGAPS